MQINPLDPPIPHDNDTQLIWDGLSGAAISLSIANLSKTIDKPIIIITPDVHTAEKIFHEIQFFVQAIPLYLFPDRETLPYDHFSPHEDLTSERLHILSLLQIG